VLVMLSLLMHVGFEFCIQLCVMATSFDVQLIRAKTAYGPQDQKRPPTQYGEAVDASLLKPVSSAPPPAPMGGIAASAAALASAELDAFDAEQVRALENQIDFVAEELLRKADLRKELRKRLKQGGLVKPAGGRAGAAVVSAQEAESGSESDSDDPLTRLQKKREAERAKARVPTSEAMWVRLCFTSFEAGMIPEYSGRQCPIIFRVSAQRQHKKDASNAGTI